MLIPDANLPCGSQRPVNVEKNQGLGVRAKLNRHFECSKSTVLGKEAAKGSKGDDGESNGAKDGGWEMVCGSKFLQVQIDVE